MLELSKLPHPPQPGTNETLGSPQFMFIHFKHLISFQSVILNKRLTFIILALFKIEIIPFIPPIITELIADTMYIIRVIITHNIRNNGFVSVLTLLYGNGFLFPSGPSRRSSR